MFLSHLVDKNSTDFASFATRLLLPSNNILVSLDVVSLFTNIPVNRAKEIAYKRLLADTSLEDRTMLSPAEVSRLLEFCLNATYLAYRGEYYQQNIWHCHGFSCSDGCKPGHGGCGRKSFIEL